MSQAYNFQLEEKAINTIRFLSADAIQNAKSGHPGLPMGAASIGYTIWMKHLRFNPKNPHWADRDRFILSGGHGSMLLYSLLHLTGYDVSLEELRRFRQLESLTPGHPEYGVTPGVEVTTGPLGQGFANGVGFAIAEKHLAAIFNRPGYEVVDHHVYAIVTDGDLMEGVASEAASLAGHLQLGKLIYVYDDNRISIDGSTDITFTENRGDRFRAYGWHVISGIDGNNVDEIDSAIQYAKSDPRPSLIICQTHIGYGLPNKQDTPEAHGEPPGEQELLEAKKIQNWPQEPCFYIPGDVKEHFSMARDRGAGFEQEWTETMASYRRHYPDDAKELERRLEGYLPSDWNIDLPVFPESQSGMATRASSGKVLNMLAKRLPELIGGSADLAPSNKTWIEDQPSFQANNPEGRNFHFGVREHGMGSIVNGISVHGGVIPYGGTFLVFSDYMRPAIRVSALSSYPSIWVFTHDSIGLGEDGPTHQPVEHIASLRAIPDLTVIRPADANEVLEAWKIAIERRNNPSALVLSRQKVPTLDRSEFSSAIGLRKGAYILKDLGPGEPEVILMATGTEVELIINAGILLTEEGIGVRLVSFPSWELFEETDIDYQLQVFPESIKNRVSVEAGVALGWKKWVGDNGKIISVDHYGSSAPYNELYKKYGLTVDEIMRTVKSML